MGQLAHKDNMKDILDAMSREGATQFEPEEREVFVRWLQILENTGMPFLLGGAFAVHAYTGVWRDTKDLDIFIWPRDLKKALHALASVGFKTEVPYPNWLAKARQEPYVMDLIFGVWNGQIPVDQDWFKRSVPGEVAGVPVQIMPIEEILASKLYVAARDRFDGSDVLHLIRCSRGNIDWKRVLARLDGNYELLLWHFILFDFAYPGHTEYLPQDLVVRLFERVRLGWSEPRDPKKFRGSLLDPFSFEVDLKDWGYQEERRMEPLVDHNGDLLHESARE